MRLRSPANSRARTFCTQRSNSALLHGLRWVSPGGWEFGAVERVQTLCLGNSDTDELLGIADRKWTLEYREADAISVGFAYNYYAVKLSSNESEMNGQLKVRHHGPAAFFPIGF